MYRLDQLSKYLRIFITSVSLLFLFSVPVSRIYLGAHWFTDVLEGFFLGLLSLMVISYFYLKTSVGKQK